MTSSKQDIDRWIRQSVGRSQTISKEVERELVQAWREKGCEESRNKLIIAHQKLVAGMATQFSRSGASFADLFNEGMIALIAAADRFELSRGCRFSTYASWWILSQLQEAVHREIYSVKIGRSRREKKALRLLTAARQIFGTPLDTTIISRISELTDIDAAVIERVDGAISSRSVSLNAAASRDMEGSVEVGDLIIDEEALENGPEAAALTADQQRILDEIFSVLSDRRAEKILRDRWLSGDEPTMREIGEELGVSAERIRQIERASLKELRDALAKRGITSEKLLQ